MRPKLPATLALLTLLTGCGSAAAAGTARPAIPSSARAAAVTGTGMLGLDVLHRLPAGQSLVTSPAGLDAVLAMLLPGARGATAAAISKVMHNGVSARQIAEATGALQRAAAGPSLRESDTLWTSTRATPSPGYLRTVSSAFHDAVHQADFAGDPEAARATINATIAQQTDGKIKQLFPAGSITGTTALVLANAIYMHANWLHAFDPSRTHDAPFHLLNGSTAPVPTMSAPTDRVGYATAPGWQAAELPYAGGDLAMDIVLPTSGYPAFRSGLTQARLASILGALRPATVNLALPKFTLGSNETLDGILSDLGMGVAFGPSADFSGMGMPHTDISTVVQDSYIQVDEKGTTAASATGAGMSTLAEMSGNTTMTVDRPFLFAIRDVHTGQVLFLGQVTDPR